MNVLRKLSKALFFHHPIMSDEEYELFDGEDDFVPSDHDADGQGDDSADDMDVADSGEVSLTSVRCLISPLLPPQWPRKRRSDAVAENLFLLLVVFWRVFSSSSALPVSQCSSTMHIYDLP